MENEEVEEEEEEEDWDDTAEEAQWEELMTAVETEYQAGTTKTSRPNLAVE